MEQDPASKLLHRSLQGKGMRAGRPEQEAAKVREKPNTTETNVSVGESARPVKAIKCTFCEVIPIDLQAFQESSTRLVECPNCGATRTLEPHRGVLRFKSHDKRKTKTPVTGVRWARRETIWKVVGGEDR
jgi:hypothetical protein